MSDIFIKDFPMNLNGHWGACSDHIVIHGNGSVTDTKGRAIGNAKAVQVVRCRYCRYRVDPDKCCHPDGLLRKKNDDFCSYGKRGE